MNQTLIDLIGVRAAGEGLPANLVEAMVQTESAGDTWAWRHEPGYKWLTGDHLTMTTTERMGQMSSWGLLQVMGGVARELGYTGSFPQLCDPGIGLAYGCQHMAKFYAKHGNWPDAIASYNAGSPRKNHDGTYVNQSYVDKVTRAWNLLDQQRQL